MAGIASTAWPFVAALVAGWGAARAWQRPRELVPGLVIWVVTVAVGMLLRAVSGQGTALPFVIVATVFLGAVLLGWRAALIFAVDGRPRRW